MSVHGLCYDLGQAGKCGADCYVYQDGNCPISEEIDEILQLPETVQQIRSQPIETLFKP